MFRAVRFVVGALLAAASLDAQPSGLYTKPSPDLPFWQQVIRRAGEKSLDPSKPAIRLVWVPEALITAAVVTVEPQGHGAVVRVQDLPDRRTIGARTSQHQVTDATWARLRTLADAGIWRQPAVAPSDAPPNMFDGVLWYAEATRGDDKWAVVRHEPCDKDFLSLISEILRVADLSEKQPRCGP